MKPLSRRSVRTLSLAAAAAALLAVGTWSLGRRAAAPASPERPNPVAPDRREAALPLPSSPAAPSEAAAPAEVRKAVGILRDPGALRERGGRFGIATDRYRATFDAFGITVAAPGRDSQPRPSRLSLAFESLTRGKEIIATGGRVPPVAAADRESVSYSRGLVEERYSFRKEGLEQEFIVGALPRGQGNLTVTCAVATALERPREGSRAGRLAFTHEGAEVLALSKAVAVDADGRKLPLALAWADGRVSMTVPAGWMDQARFPVSIDPLIGSPLVVEPNADLGWAGSVTYGSLNNEWLVTWSEVFGATSLDVFAQRVSSAGALVGPRLQLSTNADYDGGAGYIFASYAPGPDRYLVVWVRQTFTNQYSIYGAVLNADGSFFKPAQELVPAVQNGFVVEPRVAHGGGRWLLVYRRGTLNFAPPAGLEAVWVKHNGVTEPFGELVATPAGGMDASASLSFANQMFVLSWHHYEPGVGSGYVVRLMDPTGAWLSPVTTVEAGSFSVGSTAIVGEKRALFALIDPSSNSLRARVADFSVPASISFVTPTFTLAQGPSGWAPSLAGVYSAADNLWDVLHSDPASPSELRLAQVRRNGLLLPAQPLPPTWGPVRGLAAALNPTTQETLVAYADSQAGLANIVTRKYLLTEGVPDIQILSPLDGFHSTLASFPVSGISRGPGKTVTLKVDGVASGQTTSSAAGTWSLLPASPLTPGVHVLTASDGKNFVSAPVTVTVDSEPPTISSPSPAPGSSVDGPLTISADWSDESGIYLPSALVLVDGYDVTGLATLSPTGFSYAPPWMSQGDHQVTVYVSDNSGGTAVYFWSFTLNQTFGDTQPPTVAYAYPAPGSITASSLVAFDLAVQDDLSGINVGSVSLTVDGQGVPLQVSSGSPNYVSFTAQTTITVEGSHSVQLSFYDNAYNFGSASWTFIVDLTPPVFSNLSPAPGSTVQTTTPTISASWSDAITSVLPGTAVIQLDGAIVPATVNASGFIFTPSTPLSAGTHTVTAQVADEIGDPGTATWSFTVETSGPTAPVLSNLKPIPGSTIGLVQPLISGNWANDINTATAHITLDSDDITAQANVTLTGYSYVPPAPLAQGLHTVGVQIGNHTGQSTLLAYVFTIQGNGDTTPPVISALVPANGDLVRSTSLLLSASVSDSGGSFIDPNSLVFTVNTIAVPASVTFPNPANLNQATVSFQAALGEGSNSFSIRIRDGSGNLAGPVGSTFTVDSIAPTVTISDPAADGSFSPLAVPLNASIQDTAPGGVDVAAVTVFLNNNDITDSLIRSISGNGVAVSGTLNSSEGGNTLRITATDRAGNSGQKVIGYNASATTGVGTLTLTSISPSKAGPGARVRVLGSGFSAAGQTQVTFSTGQAVTDFESLTDTQIVLRVPFGAVSGPVTVTAGGADSNSVPFQVLNLGRPPGIPITSCLTDDNGNAIISFTDLVVSLQDAEGPDLADALATQTGGTMIGHIPSGNIFVIRYGTTDLAQLIAKRDIVRSTPGVEMAAPAVALPPTAQDSLNSRYKKDLTEGRAGIWAWDRVQAPAAWRMLKGSSLSPVKIAVWDTGIDRGHADFQGVTVTAMTDAGVEVPYTGGDTVGHGSAVAGIIGAAANDVGIDGVIAPPLREAGVPYTLMVFPASEISGGVIRVNFSHLLIDAIDRAASRDVRVVNVSSQLHVHKLTVTIQKSGALGDPFTKAVEIIKDHLFLFRKAMGVGRRTLVVLAAGNDAKDVGASDDEKLSLLASIHAFGAVDSVMIVGGIGMSGNIWNEDSVVGSNGAFEDGIIDIAAPSEHVLVPLPNGSEFEQYERRVMADRDGDANSRYDLDNGTSLAAPFVSGAAALCYSLNPSLRAGAVKQLLINNALPCKVTTLGGDQIQWRLLRMADTYAAQVPALAAKSWSRVYATVFDQNANYPDLRRFKKVQRSGATYQASDSETFLSQRYLDFQVAANGNSLVTPLHEMNGSEETQHIERYAIPDAAATRLVNNPYSFIDQPLGGGSTEKITTSLAINPKLFASDGLFYLSKLDYQPYNPSDTSQRDRAPYEPYVLEHGRLTQINRDPWTATTVGGTSVTVDEDLAFGHVSTTPDNRWIVFCNAVSNLAATGSHIYITDNPNVDHTQYQDPDVRTRLGQDRFVVVSKKDGDTPVEHASSPKVSPDGSRIAFIDPRFNVEKPLKILRMEKLPLGFTGADIYSLVKSWHYEEQFEVPGKVYAYAWSPCGTHLIYLDRDEPGVIKIVSANLGEYTNGNSPPAATALITLENVSSIQNLDWAWVEK